MGKTINVVRNKKPSVTKPKVTKPRKPRITKSKKEDKMSQSQNVVVNVGHVVKPRAPRKPRAPKPQAQQQVSVIRPPVISPPHTSVYNPPSAASGDKFFERSIFNKEGQREVNQLSELIKSLQTQKVAEEERAKPNALEKTKPKVKTEEEQFEEQVVYDKLAQAERKKSLDNQVEELFKEAQTTSLLGELRGQPNFPSFDKNIEDEPKKLKETPVVRQSKYKKALSSLGLEFGLTPFSLENPEPRGSLIDRLASEARTESLSVVAPKLSGEVLPALKVPQQAPSLLASVEQPKFFEEERRQPQAELEVEPAFVSVLEAPAQEGELELGFSLEPAPSAASGDKGMARGLTELNLEEQPTEPPPPEPLPYEGSEELPPAQPKDLRALVKKAEEDVELFPKKGQGLVVQVQGRKEKEPELSGEAGGKKEYSTKQLKNYWEQLLSEGKFSGLNDDQGNPLENTKYITDTGTRSTKRKEQLLQNIRQVEPSFGLNF